MGTPHRNDVPGTRAAKIDRLSVRSKGRTTPHGEGSPLAGTTSADPASKRTKGLYGALAASSVGLEFGVAVVIGALFGNWLDGRFATAPWLLIAFTIIGFVAGLRAVLRAVARMNRGAQ